MILYYIILHYIPPHRLCDSKLNVYFLVMVNDLRILNSFGEDYDDED